MNIAYQSWCESLGACGRHALAVDRLDVMLHAVGLGQHLLGLMNLGVVGCQHLDLLCDAELWSVGMTPTEIQLLRMHSREAMIPCGAAPSWKGSGWHDSAAETRVVWQQCTTTVVAPPIPQVPLPQSSPAWTPASRSSPSVARGSRCRRRSSSRCKRAAKTGSSEPCPKAVRGSSCRRRSHSGSKRDKWLVAALHDETKETTWEQAARIKLHLVEAEEEALLHLYNAKSELGREHGHRPLLYVIQGAIHTLAGKPNDVVPRPPVRAFEAMNLISKARSMCTRDHPASGHLDEAVKKARDVVTWRIQSLVPMGNRAAYYYEMLRMNDGPFEDPDVFSRLMHAYSMTICFWFPRNCFATQSKLLAQRRGGPRERRDRGSTAAERERLLLGELCDVLFSDL